MDKHVPLKLTSSRFNQPWITGDFKKLARWKKKSYNKAFSIVTMVSSAKEKNAERVSNCLQRIHEQ